MRFYAVYNKTIFRNEDNGYTIFAVNSKDVDKYKNENGSIICGGTIPVCTKGTPLLITGSPNYKNKKFIIDVSEVEISSNDKEITVQYLSSDTFKGIGRKTAEKIVDITGNDIFSFIQKHNANEIIESNLPEFNSDKTRLLINTIRNTFAQRDIFKFLQCVGGTYGEAMDLYEKYGANALCELKKDPYTIGNKSGIPFVVCDCIARKEGFYYLDKKRLKAIIYEALNIITNSGNTYTTANELFYIVNLISKRSAFPTEIPSLIIASEISSCKGIVCVEEDNNILIYTKKYFDYENGIVFELLRLKRSALELPFHDEYIKNIEAKYNIKYSESQRKTFSFLKKSGIKLLCGYAGTGKTTVQKGIIAAYKMMFPNGVISLCAPTGRAAQRMANATGMPALTIHKLLDIKPFKDGDYKCKDKENQLDSDLIIVDEVSMIDTELFYILLRAVKSGATVIMCGDPSQLQSVGPGNVLLDLLNSGKFDTNTLDVVYRQSEGSKIIKNANNIRNGCCDIKNGKEFELIRVSSQKEIGEKIAKIYKRHFDINNPFNIEILSSTKKGDSGVYALNQFIQKTYNHNDAKLTYGKTTYKIGDIVMMLSNNYELEYYNGEIGTICSVDDGQIEISIDERKIKLPAKFFKDISLAYATTVHKSQGSEFPIVIIALSNFPYNMLNRNLLYTAVTRAKDKVYLISEDDALETAIKKEMINSRKTSLQKKIQNFSDR